MVLHEYFPADVFQFPFVCLFDILFAIEGQINCVLMLLGVLRATSLFLLKYICRNIFETYQLVDSVSSVEVTQNLNSSSIMLS